MMKYQFRMICSPNKLTLPLRGTAHLNPLLDIQFLLVGPTTKTKSLPSQVQISTWSWKCHILRLRSSTSTSACSLSNKVDSILLAQFHIYTLHYLRVCQKIIRGNPGSGWLPQARALIIANRACDRMVSILFIASVFSLHRDQDIQD